MPETGVTLIEMDAGLDTGPIVAVERWHARRATRRHPSSRRGPRASGAGLVVEVDRAVAARRDRGHSPAERGGDADPAAPARRRAPRSRPVRHRLLERQVRAYQPWPGSFIETEAGRLIVWRGVRRDDRRGRPPPGSIGPGPDLRLATADGWLVLDEVQPAGGRRMAAG